MLQDFYLNFQEMHDAVRERSKQDLGSLEEALAKLREAKNNADYRGEKQAELDEALAELDKHLAERKKQLA